MLSVMCVRAKEFQDIWRSEKFEGREILKLGLLGAFGFFAGSERLLDESGVL